MIDRISKNEERLDKLLESIKKLNNALDEFESNKKDLDLLKKYYGSKTWFKDKELYESEKIKNIKAGVLSEDAVWNMLDEIDELMNRMKNYTSWYRRTYEYR